MMYCNEVHGKEAIHCYVGAWTVLVIVMYIITLLRNLFRIPSCKSIFKVCFNPLGVTVEPDLPI